MAHYLAQNSTLRANGFLYCSNPERTVFRWIAPGLRRFFYRDWIDTTHMSDAEFYAFATAE
ncbi:hypothetical protein CURE108131_23060 [Cupriavidus respiraculi]|uniref:Uncharacterized protein n=1 Tax=Cupriavidus respiraculi TaxID=195930 RepID=A0ABN7YK03_9BURK|nr:hypothetical protein [Cupriavidus respiraculi]CAG9172465.1 hypothetical protein LMG21510_01983 [Cupriavidus respiraculi]